MSIREYFYQTMNKEDIEKIVDISTICELEELCKSRYFEKTAIKTFENSWSYLKLFEDVAKTRGWLINNGYKKGDNIALWIGNRYEFVRIFLAAETLGIVPVLLHPLTPVQALQLLSKKFDFTGVIGENADVEISGLKYHYASDTISTPAPMAKVNETDPACIVLTSGTEGKTKGAVLSHKNICTGIINGVLGVINCFQHVYLAIIPFTHVFGLIRSLLTALYSGATVYICENMQNIYRDVNVAKANILILVPGLVELLYGIIKTKGIDYVGKQLTTIISGGATVSPSLVKKMGEFGITLYPGYGLTETANLVTGNIFPERKPSSLGAFYPNQEYRIVEGELWLKGDNIMSGYYNDPEENKSCFEDGWFKTGDLVRVDSDEDLFFVGRSKNIIVLSNGENISPEIIEAKFNAQESVFDSLVYSKIENGVENIVAEVYPRKEVISSISDVEKYFQEILMKVNSELPLSMKVAKIIVRKEDFNRGKSGKVIRK